MMGGDHRSVVRTGTVILDFDGVIADSMPQHLEAYRRVLQPFGVEVMKHDVYLREGARSESIIQTLLGDRKEAQDPSQIKRLGDEKQRIFLSLGEVSLYPEAQSFVRGIRGIASKLGVVTGTKRENVEKWSGDLLPLFDAVVAEDAYRRDKPHPEPYENAISALKADPSDSIVVENAPRGIESAKAAGAGTVIAIATTLSPDQLEKAGPDIVVRDHDTALQTVRDRLHRSGGFT